jgi:hypothetical protein
MIKTNKNQIKMTKLNKIQIEVKKEVKIDGRKNNTGRPVNKTSERQKRLAKQAFYADVNSKFKKGNQFKVNRGDYSTYAYKPSKDDLGCIVSEAGSFVCNVSYVGRTKVQGYTFILGKRVNVELNLKTLQFIK